METLFENDDFILKSTGHDYDFVGFIVSKSDRPRTFFFEEHDVEGLTEEHYAYFYDKDLDLDESRCRLDAEYVGTKAGSEEDEFAISELRVMTENCSYITLEPFESIGFLSDCQQRGWFLALVKAFCQDRLKDIPWA